MPTLPDVTSLGNAPLPSARSTPNYGAPASYRAPDFVQAPTPGRRSIQREANVARPSVQLEAPRIEDNRGRGYEALGRGVVEASAAATNYYSKQLEAQNAINGASAHANLVIQKSQLEQQIENSTDPNEIADLKKQANDIPLNAAKTLVGQDQELFLAKSMPYVADIHAKADGRIGLLNKQSDMAAYDGTLNDLSKAYVAGDQQTKSDALNSAMGIYDAMAVKGYGALDVIEKEKTRWAQNAEIGRIDTLPASERIHVLGGVKPGAVAATDLQPHQVAFLNAVAGPESAGAYNARYPGGTFENYTDHPRMRAVIPNGPNAGKTSDAAGRYQFLSSTWDRLPDNVKGDGTFSPVNQDHAAWFLAQRDYKARTGRDLDTELREKGFTPDMIDALSGTWEGFKTNPKKAIAAYNATMTGRPDVTAAGEYTGDPRASVIPIETRLHMLQKAIADDNKISVQQRTNEKLVGTDMETDAKMVASTGIPMDGLRERVQATFGPQAVQQLDNERQRAATFFTATTNMAQAPNNQLDALAEPLKPILGSPDYANQIVYYNDALKKVSQIRDQRADDPAGYVDAAFPEVAQAKTNVDPQDPATFQRVVSARVSAQKALDIPPEFTSVISESEAKDYAAKLRPFTKGQAEIMGQEDLATSIAQDIQTKYGPYAKDAWRRVLLHVTLKNNLADTLADAVSSVAAGQPINVNTPRTAQAIQQDKDQERAALIAGETKRVTPIAPAPTVPAGGQYSTPQDKLRAHPELIQTFVNKYGVKAVPADMRNLLTSDQQALLTNNPLGSK